MAANNFLIKSYPQPHFLKRAILKNNCWLLFDNQYNT